MVNLCISISISAVIKAKIIFMENSKSNILYNSCGNYDIDV